MTMIRVLVVAAYPALRAGLRALFDGAEGVDVVGERSPSALLALPDEEEPADVLVLDLGDEADMLLASLDELMLRMPTVLLASDPEDFRGIDLSGSAPRAYLLREAGAEELAAAVHGVERGLVVMDPSVAHLVTERRRDPLRAALDAPAETLTERESEVLALVALGLPNKGIALRLGISEHTVKFHVGAILAKLGAAGRTEAVMVAARRGLLPL